VNVGSTTIVMTGHEGIEGSDTIGIGGLKATEGGSLQDGGIVRVTHSRVALDTDVDTLAEQEWLAWNCTIIIIRQKAQDLR